MPDDKSQQRVTDTIPRSAALQILQVLDHIASSGGRSTFEQVRLLLVRRSSRSAPSSASAMYTVARDVLIDLEKLGFIETSVIPRTQSQLETHGDAAVRLTEPGRGLATTFKENAGRTFDQLLLAWVNRHPYFRALVTRLHAQPLYVPDITSAKQIGSDFRSDEGLDALASRITDHCLKRLTATGFHQPKVDRFKHAVGERVQDLGRTAFSGLDAKKWVDTIQDRVVIPAFLTAEELPFSDAVTFQYVIKAAKDFFAASWTSSHPRVPVRIIFPTCEFRPAIAGDESITEVIHHGKSFAAPRFLAAIRAAYDVAATPPGSYADAYAVRALVCISLQIHPKVFATCLSELIAGGPSPDLTIFTELPFDPPPPGEDYVEIDRNRIGLLKLVSSNNGGQ